MKRLILTTIIVLLGCTTTMAQKIDFGVKAGAVFNTDKGKVWSDAEGIFNRGKASSGFQAGLLARVSLLNLYIQPEILYSQFKNQYDHDGLNFSVTKKRIDLPVNIGRKVLKFGHVQLGPVFSYYLDDNISLNNISNLKQEDFNVAMQFGTGVKFSKLLVDLRYEFGFGKMTSKFIRNNTNFTTEQRPSMLNLTVGYLF